MIAGAIIGWIGLRYMASHARPVIGIGFAARRSIKSSLDFFLSGRSLEILGMAANGAQYGISAVPTTGSAPCRRWCSSAS